MVKTREELIEWLHHIKHYVTETGFTRCEEAADMLKADGERIAELESKEERERQGLEEFREWRMRDE